MKYRITVERTLADPLGVEVIVPLNVEYDEALHAIRVAESILYRAFTDEDKTRQTSDLRRL